MTAGPTATINQNQRNYEQHHYGMTPTVRNNYEHHEFQPNSFQQRQANYEATRIAKFGETNPFQAPASVAGHGKLGGIIPVLTSLIFRKLRKSPITAKIVTIFQSWYIQSVPKSLSNQSNPT